MSRQSISIPATSSARICAASSATCALLGWTSSVTSVAVPPVERLPLRAQLDHLARLGDRVTRQPLLRQHQRRPRRRSRSG